MVSLLVTGLQDHYSHYGNVVLQKKGSFFVSKMSEIKETDKGAIVGLGTWYKMSLYFISKK